MQQVGRITSSNKGLVEVFWNPETREVQFHELSLLSRFVQKKDWQFAGGPIWHPPQDDGNIIGSIAKMLGCQQHELCANQMMVFGRDGKKGKDYKELVTDIYDCDWSDFACDGLMIHLNVRYFDGIKDSYERLATAIEHDRWYPGNHTDHGKIQRHAAEMRAAAAV